ncbi:MAG: Lrp/AsnC family transcriptional regulator [Crocinitomicaceae bacterium]
MKLDEIDDMLLQKLSTNARQTVKELAHKVGLSITPTFERIKRLERLGIIKGYTVVINKKLVNKGLRVLCQVSLKEHNEKQIQLFESEVQSLVEVSECLHIAGNFDYLLSVEIKDMEEYEKFLKQKLARLSNISQVQSSFVLGSVSM